MRTYRANRAIMRRPGADGDIDDDDDAIGDGGGDPFEEGGGWIDPAMLGLQVDSSGYPIRRAAGPGAAPKAALQSWIQNAI